MEAGRGAEEEQRIRLHNNKIVVDQDEINKLYLFHLSAFIFVVMESTALLPSGTVGLFWEHGKHWGFP